VYDPRRCEEMAERAALSVFHCIFPSSIGRPAAVCLGSGVPNLN
jgi:hypothetical protein